MKTFLLRLEAGALGKPPLSQLAVTCLGPGLDQPELGLRQIQIAADETARAVAHRHSSRPEHVCLRAAVQFVSGELRRASRKRRVLGFHQRGDVPRGIESWFDRPLLPLKDYHRARPQPYLQQTRESSE